jgi:hypothetical protein
MRTHDDVEHIVSLVRTAVVRDHRRRTRRRYLALLMLCSFASLASVGIAATGEWWDRAPAAPNEQSLNRQLAPQERIDGSVAAPADVARARLVAETPGARLAAAPTEDGGYCLVPSVENRHDLGFVCFSAEGRESGADSSFASWAGESSEPDQWYVFGRITDHAARAIDLSKPAGVPLRIRLQKDGFFVLGIPDELWSRLDGRRGQADVLDARGRKLRSACVFFGTSPSTTERGAGPSAGRAVGTAGCP